MSLWTSVFGTNSYRRFVVISNARTGSNLLYSYLNSHPNIKMYGEIFRFLDGKSIQEIYKSYFSKKLRRIKASGFKLFYTHPEDGNNEEMLQLVEQLNDPLIIHLTRRDKLNTLVSWKIALMTDTWGLKQGTPRIPIEKKKITIEPGEALKFFYDITKHEHDIEQRFREKDYVHIIYEDLIGHPEETLMPILKRLDVPAIPLKTSFIKSNPEPLQDLIINYQELVNKEIIEKLKSK